MAKKKLVLKKHTFAAVASRHSGDGGGVKKSISPRTSGARSSNRLAGLPPDHVPTPAPVYSIRDEIKYTAEGVKVTRKWLYEDDKRLELRASSSDYKIAHFYPGQIIRATMSSSVSNPDRDLFDTAIAAHRDGPVYSKKRPMIVLWKTHIGLFCLPVLSMTKGLDEPWKWEEFVDMKAVGDEEGETETKWHGPSIRFVPSQDFRKELLKKKRSYVNVANPCYINRYEDMTLNIGHLTGDSYARLIAAFDFRQQRSKEAAFRAYGHEMYSPANPMVAWPGDPSKTSEQQKRAAAQEERMACFEPRWDGDGGLDGTKLVKKLED